MGNIKKYTDEQLLEHRRLASKAYFIQHKEEQREKCRENYRKKYFLYNIDERAKKYNDKFTFIFNRLYSYYDNLDTKRGYTLGRSIKQDIKLLISLLKRSIKLDRPICDITIDYKDSKINFKDITILTITNFRSCYCNFKIL